MLRRMFEFNMEEGIANHIVIVNFPIILMKIVILYIATLLSYTSLPFLYCYLHCHYFRLIIVLYITVTIIYIMFTHHARLMLITYHIATVVAVTFTSCYYTLSSICSHVLN